MPAEFLKLLLPLLANYAANAVGAVKQAAVRAVKRALDEAGIEIPYPQMDVHLRQPGQ